MSTLCWLELAGWWEACPAPWADRAPGSGPLPENKHHKHPTSGPLPPSTSSPAASSQRSLPLHTTSYLAPALSARYKYTSTTIETSSPGFRQTNAVRLIMAIPITAGHNSACFSENQTLVTWKRVRQPENCSPGPGRLGRMVDALGLERRLSRSCVESN